MIIGLHAGCAEAPPARACPRADRPAGTPIGVTGRVLRWAALRSQRRSPFHQREGLQRTLDARTYDAWRAASLRDQLTSHFDAQRLRGKTVLDFGCGTGELSLDLVRTHACRNVVGVDLSAQSLERASAKRADLPPEQRSSVRFVHAVDDRPLDVPDNSVDYVCCFDVIEHIPSIDDAAAQWRRVLKPRGEVWIWWSPWRGPYGHHVESLIPLPWFHLVVRPETIFAVCADIYDDPSFRPRTWDIDPKTKAKRPNKWRAARSFEPFLNRLTRRQFERSVRDSGLAIVERRTHGFGSSRWSRATRPFKWTPLLGECLVSCYTYRLCRP